jgi:hypothetical protein
MDFRRVFIFLVIAAALPLYGNCQKSVTISGIVVDSISLVALPNVHLKAKRSSLGVIAGQSGVFKVTVPVFDTLVISCIGYRTMEYPVLLNEEDVLIRLRESFIMLPEVTTIGSRLEAPTYDKRRPVVSPTPTLAEGIFSPFTYFSRTEREKRKLVKVQEENVRIRTYVEVVNDPDLKKDMMNEFSISERDFFSLLAKFNKENQYAQYLVSEVQIREILAAFIKKELINRNSD